MVSSRNKVTGPFRRSSNQQLFIAIIVSYSFSFKEDITVTLDMLSMGHAVDAKLKVGDIHITGHYTEAYRKGTVA